MPPKLPQKAPRRAIKQKIGDIDIGDIAQYDFASLAAGGTIEQHSSVVDRGKIIQRLTQVHSGLVDPIRPPAMQSRENTAIDPWENKELLDIQYHYGSESLADKPLEHKGIATKAKRRYASSVRFPIYGVKHLTDYNVRMSC